MTKYHKCTGCIVDRESCERRAAIQSAVAGLGVSFVKFACPDRLAAFATGQRVSVWLPIYDYNAGMYETSETYESVFPGTIVKEAKNLGRYIVRLDNGENGDGYKVPADLKTVTGFVKVAEKFISLTGEPDREVCATCGEVGGVHADGWSCGLP
jgi:hypothetical protein